MVGDSPSQQEFCTVAACGKRGGTDLARVLIKYPVELEKARFLVFSDYRL
jgi:hypothetical protein